MLEIRKMENPQVETAAALERECFSSPWTAPMLASALENPGEHFFAAFYDGNFAGYGGFLAVLDEGYVDSIAVRPELRRLGVASGLMSEMFKESERLGLAFLTLEVRTQNTGALALYEKQGFRRTGLRRGYYHEPEDDALLMTKYFTGEAQR